MSLINTTEASTSTAIGGHIAVNPYPHENNNHIDNDMINVVGPMNDIDNNMDAINHDADDNASVEEEEYFTYTCLLYTSPSPRDATLSRMPSSA